MATGYNLPGKLSLSGNLSENFKKFNQSFTIYLEAAGLAEATEGRKIAIFLNLIGEDALNVYNTLKTEDLKTLKAVQEILEKFCNPKKNGAAERAVGICKNFLKKSNETKTEIENFLLEYRNTPVVGLNLSPAQLLFNRLCRTKLPVKNTLLKPKLNPEIKNILTENALKNKLYYDQHTRPRTDIFKEGQKVVFKENEHSNIWKPATIIKINENPRSIIVKDNMGNLKTRNTWFIKTDQGQDPVNGSMNTQSFWSQVATPEQLSVQPTSVMNPNIPTPPVQLRRSNRDVRPPSHLMDYVTDLNN